MKHFVKTKILNKNYGKKQIIPALVIVAAIAVLGAQLIVFSHAATPSGSVEAVDGLLTGSALKSTEESSVVFGKAPTTTTGGSSTTGATTGEHIIVPSYISPGDSAWTAIDAGYPTDPIAFINPDSGPGGAEDPATAAQVKESQTAGIAIYGYVWSDYGALGSGSTLAEMEAQVTDYLNWYGITNIFFDGASTDCSLETSVYLPLYNFVHANGGKVMLNPGTQTSQCYMSASDIVATYEGDGAEYASQTEPSWASSYAASRFFNIVYDTSAADMSSMVSHAKSINVGYIYVTDATEPNPYDVLPSYWTQELTTVAE